MAAPGGCAPAGKEFLDSEMGGAAEGAAEREPRLADRCRAAAKAEAHSGDLPPGGVNSEKESIYRCLRPGETGESPQKGR